MHIPSERISREMNGEEGALWYVPANGGEELALLVKMPTTSIKALIAGCSLRLFFGKKNSYLCVGVQISDIPSSPIFISKIQTEAEEHDALFRALKKKNIPLFLFSEMDKCLAWNNLELTKKDAYDILNYIGEKSELYTGFFTSEMSHALDCFGYHLILQILGLTLIQCLYVEYVPTSENGASYMAISIVTIIHTPLQSMKRTRVKHLSE